MRYEDIINVINTLYGIVNSNSANQFLSEDELNVVKEKLMNHIKML